MVPNAPRGYLEAESTAGMTKRHAQALENGRRLLALLYGQTARPVLGMETCPETAC